MALLTQAASIPANIFESELFGHEKGAFTGAQFGKPGKFEAAGKGTIFLDEISSLPFELQAKLLTTLEERKAERLGSTRPYAVKAKIIAATNKDLDEMVKKKKFRADLFYRLNVIQIQLPPLRHHKEDIELLIYHFLKKYEDKFMKTKHKISSDVLNVLKIYDWPGNIRELENVIERAVVLAADSTITMDDIYINLKHTAYVDENFQDTYSEELSERAVILEALRKHLGSRTKTAEYLGVSRRTLQYKLKNLGII